MVNAGLKKVVLIGGLSGRLGSNLNLRLAFPEDIWIYRGQTQAWALAFGAIYGPQELFNSNQTQTKARLVRRAFHSCTSLQSSIHVVRCFGGAAPKAGEEPQSPGARTYLLSDLVETSDFFELDLRDGALARVARRQHSPWPAARVDATMTSFGQFTVLAGGGMLSGTRAPLPDMDVWLYSDVTQTWRLVQAVGNAPTSRFSPVIMSVDYGLDPTDPRRRLLLVGGCEFDDIYSCMPCSTATAAVGRADKSRIYSTNPNCLSLRRSEAADNDVLATGTANASYIDPPGHLPINPKQGHLLLLNDSALHANGSGDPSVPAEGEWHILEAANNLLIPALSLLSRQPCAAASHEATLRCLGPTGGAEIMVTLRYISEFESGSPSGLGTLQGDAENPDGISESLAIYGGGNLAELSRGYFLHFGGFAGLNFLGSTGLYSTGGRFWSELGAAASEGIELLRPAVAVAGDTAFVFGGISAENEVSGDLWRVDLRSSTWTRVAGVDAPGVRYGASLTPLPSRDMLCYGGIGNGWLGDGRPVQHGIYILKSGILSGLFSAQGQSPWRVVPPDENSRSPPPRSGHSAVSLSQDGDEFYRVFVYGGWEEIQVTDLATAKVRDDLWIFSVEANKPAEEGRWLKPTVDKQHRPIFPMGRAEHVGGGIWLDNDERVMVISGGLVFSGDASSPVAESAGDVWLLHFNVHADGNVTFYWTSPDIRMVQGDKPFLFFSATAAFNQRDLYVYGGLVKQEDAWVHSSAVYLGRASSDGAVWTWQQLQLSPASSRFGSTLAALSGPHGPILLSAGGAQLQASGMTTKLPILRAELACPPGKYQVSFFLNCISCPRGTFSTTPGSTACTACPGDGYTTDEGASTVANCTICRPAVCSGNGLCSLNRGTNMASCQCRSGYAGKNCSRNVGLTTGLSLLGLILALTLAFFFIRRYRHRVSSLKGYNALQDKLIEESRLELDELKRVWEVDVADVDFVRRIDGGSEGAFGEVWLASWQGRRVAIKQLRLSVQEIDGKAEADFDAEVAFLRSLRHRNIVFFYGTGVREASPFLVTEFMERGSLHRVLVVESSTLTWERRLQFAHDVAAGMAFLHTLSPPRMHRDLKGANVLVSQDYVCKIADFGTVKLLSHISGEEYNGASGSAVAMTSQGRGFRRVFRRKVEAASTEDDTVDGSEPGLAETVDGFQNSMAARAMTTAVGTFLWTAPEMLRDEPYALPADVYSFGMVLYEIASGRVPFDEDHRPLWTLRTAITDKDYRPVMPAGTPATLVALAQACWAPRPEARPSFAAAHAQLLVILGDVSTGTSA